MAAQVDQKVSQMQTDTDLQPTDLFYIVHDAGGGTYESRKITLEGVASLVGKTVRTAVNYTSAGERYIFVTDVATPPDPRTITLSTGDFTAKRVITVKDISGGAATNPIIIITQGAEKIDGTLDRTSINIDNGELTFVSDGTTWSIIGHDDSIFGSGYERITADAVGVLETARKARPDGSGNPVTVNNGDNLFSKTLYAHDGTNYIPYGELNWQVSSAPSTNDVPTEFTFSKRISGGSSLDNIYQVDENNRFVHLTPIILTTLSLSMDGSTNGNQIIFVTDTSVPRTITLSSVNVVNGMYTTIIDASGAAATNNITIDTEGAELINGQASATISANYGVARLVGDGTNFFLR